MSKSWYCHHHHNTKIYVSELATSKASKSNGNFQWQLQLIPPLIWSSVVSSSKCSFSSFCLVPLSLAIQSQSLKNQSKPSHQKTRPGPNLPFCFCPARPLPKIPKYIDTSRPARDLLLSPSFVILKIPYSRLSAFAPPSFHPSAAAAAPLQPIEVASTTAPL